MKKIIFLAIILELLLFGLCFLPSANVFDYYAQYVRALSLKGKEAEKAVKLSLTINPFYPHSRMLLTSILLQKSNEKPELFLEALKQLKITFKIGARRGKISWNTLKTFLAMWPFLEEEDRKIAKQAGKIAIKRMNRREIDELFLLWSTYCRDYEFIKSILRERPLLFLRLANYIKENHLPLKWRWEALSNYENYIVQYLQSKRVENMGKRELLGSLRMLRSIKFYNELVGEKFDYTNYNNLMEQITGVLAHKHPSPQTIMDFANSTSSTEKIKELLNTLTQQGFFNKRDLQTFYLREYLLYKAKDYDTLKQEINIFRKQTGWINKKETDYFIKINLLLVDVYYEENMLLTASSIVEELHKNFPDSPEILLRIKRIREMMGETFDLESPNFLYGEEVEIPVKRRIKRFYFSPLVGQKTLTLKPEVFINIERGNKILTIFFNGKVAYEGYLDELPEKIKISLRDGLDFYTVEIRIW